MRVVICGSMRFAKEMIRTKEKLEKRGFRCVIPPLSFEYAKGKRKKDQGKKDIEQKGAIRYYFREIKKADAILVLNYQKKRN